MTLDTVVRGRCETLSMSVGVGVWMWPTYFHVEHFGRWNSKLCLTFDNAFLRTIDTTFNVGIHLPLLSIQCTPKLILDLKDDGILQDHKS